MMQKCSFLRKLIPKTDYVSVSAIRRISSSVQRFNQSETESEKVDQSKADKLSKPDYRYIFPEFLPDPNPEFRNALAERLQRKDLITRRNHVEIPEFYVGSFMAVTVSDSCSPHPNKLSRFVGICIDRGGCGLRAWFIVRNIIEGQGVEFMYQMYSPTVTKIEVLRLEKRLDDELYFLRDAPPEHSTVPFDMEPEILPEGSPVPVNETIVKLNPRPWLRSWEQMQGYIHGYELTDAWTTPGKIRKQMRRFSENSTEWHQQTIQYDLMRDYRNTIHTGEQEEIWDEVRGKLEERDKQMRKVAAKRAFVRPVKKH